MIPYVPGFIVGMYLSQLSHMFGLVMKSVAICYVAQDNGGEKKWKSVEADSLAGFCG
jgi:hypothetical protein